MTDKVTAMPVALEWGPIGAKVLAERSDVIVVVDVLSFSTSVTVAAERGAKVWPHTRGETAHELSREIEALRPLAECSSGQELVEKGFADDVRIASEVDAACAVPVLVEGRFVAA